MRLCGLGHSIDAIPQTVIVGPRGKIQSVHIGFEGEAAVRDRLTQELETLISGGQLVEPTPK